MSVPDSSTVGDRAGVLVRRDQHLALIERHRAGRRYWVLPGGGIEPGETAAQAARREAIEELGVGVRIGELRAVIHHREEDGSIQTQWYFDAALDSTDIAVIGPELNHEADKGSYAAVWVHFDDIEVGSVLPVAVTRWLLGLQDRWPEAVEVIDER